MASWDQYSGGSGVVGGSLTDVLVGARRQPSTLMTRTGMGGAYSSYVPLPGGGASSSAFGSPGALGGGGVSSIGGLIGMQRDENARNRALAEANWQEGKAGLLGVLPRYGADPMTTGARGLAAGLMANPEAINDQTQSLIRNAQMNQLGAQGSSAMRRGSAQLASRGQLNPAAQARMQERIGMGTQAAMSRALAQTEIDRALRRNQDIMTAMGAGRQLANDQAGLDMDVRKTFLENLPQYLPEDLSGMAALLARASSGGGGGGAGKIRANDVPSFGFQSGTMTLNPMGRQSPGQTGFAPGLRGGYQWTGEGGGYGGALSGYGVDTRRYGSGDVPYWKQPPQITGELPGDVRSAVDFFYGS